MKYRKKPIVIEAIRFDGCEPVDGIPTPMFEGSFDIMPEWLVDATAKRETEAGAVYEFGGTLQVVTLEGAMTASPGDYIIQGTAGEIYPCKPAIFAEIYERAD